MKSIGRLINFQQKKVKKRIDQETIFYLFNMIIRNNYGKIGQGNIQLKFYKNGKIFLNIKNSNWANEVWFNKKNLIQEVNQKIGSDEIKDIKMG